MTRPNLCKTCGELHTGAPGRYELDVLADPATYFWMKELVEKTRRYDPVDVLHAIERMRDIALERLGR